MSTIFSTIIQRLKKWLFAFIEWIIRDFPVPFGPPLRYAYWKTRLGRLGKDVFFDTGLRILRPDMVFIGSHCRIDPQVTIYAGPLSGKSPYIYRGNPEIPHEVKEGVVEIGDYASLNAFSFLQGFGGMKIGDYAGIGSGARIFSVSHHYKDLTGQADPSVIMKFSKADPKEQALICLPVKIGIGALIGINSVVLPGSCIGNYTYIGAMSLVKGELPEGCVAAGVPVKVIKKRW